MVLADPARWPSISRVREGGEPPRVVAVKQVVNGRRSPTATDGLVVPSGRTSSTRFSETAFFP